MTRRDGDGWVACRCGFRHWGRYGAAGLLLLREPGEALLQHRAAWVHDGGSWALPGGARDSHEDVVVAAVREAEEEVGLAADAVEIVGTVVGTDHGDWSYTYVVAAAAPWLRVHGASAETEALRWLPLAEVPTLPLHPGLAADWPRLLAWLGAPRDP